MVFFLLHRITILGGSKDVILAGLEKEEPIKENLLMISFQKQAQSMVLRMIIHDLFTSMLTQKLKLYVPNMVLFGKRLIITAREESSPATGAQNVLFREENQKELLCG